MAAARPYIQKLIEKFGRKRKSETTPEKENE
jgi:hypothetical protein